MMVVDSILIHAESGPNDHQKDAPVHDLFNLLILILHMKSHLVRVRLKREINMILTDMI